MKEFLKSLKLIENHKIELEIEKNDFVSRLKKNVDKGSTSGFFEFFEMFSSSKNEYKGEVNYNGFKIKRRPKLFDMNMNLSVAKGTYFQNGETLQINTEITGFNSILIPFFFFAMLFYGIALIGIFTTSNSSGSDLGFTIPFILLHASFMLGIPYLIMRRSVKRMKRELEREFYFLTK